MTAGNGNGAKKPLAEDMDMSSLDMVVGFHMRKAILRAQSELHKASGRNMLTGQWAVMTIIRDNPGRTQTAIAVAAGLDRSSLVPVLNRLEKNDLIVRKPVAGDKRAHAVSMTEKGLRELSEIDVQARIIEETVIAGLGEADHAKLVDLLKRFHEII